MRIEGNDHLVELNVIRNVVQESDDQGGIDMFGNPLNKFPFKNQIEPKALGSGVIINRRGYIVTNHHVVADATEVKVHLGDRNFKAEVRGMDEETDLAVLKVEG